MKYFLTFTLIFSVFFLTAQSGTTLDEYRYLSKGYAYQLEMGLDPTKSGYEIHKNYSAKNGTSIMGLYRSNSKVPQGLLFINTDANGKSYYRALPNPQSAENVLALYRQDQAQHLPKTVRDKIMEAKDHYLFMIPSSAQEEGLAHVNIPPTATTPKYSEKTTQRSPRSYESIPEVQDDQLTAKGGTPILTNEKVSTPTIGTSVTGQLNSELNARTILVVPNAQNTSKAKGRVMIKFCADTDGVVTYAKFTQRGSTTLNSQLKAFALSAVRKMRLAPSASEEDCGTVGFDF